MSESEQLRAAIDRLESERARRITEKVEHGEAVLVPLIVVTEEFEPNETTVGNAKSRELAKLRAAGEEREVFFETTIVSTGVPRPDYSKTNIEDSKEPEQNNLIPSAGDKSESGKAAATNVTEPQRIWIQTKAATEDDPGVIAEANFTVSDNVLCLTDLEGRPLGSITLRPDQDPAAEARQLLRAKTAQTGFWGPLPLPQKRWWQ